MIDKNLKMLVTDDSPTMRKIIRRMLRTLGFNNINEAVDGFDALEKLKEGRFDLLITDWNMPKMTGLELIKSVRENKALQEIQILLVTAEAEKINIIQAAQVGVNNYIIKPFAVETMKQKIDSILNYQ